MFQAVMSLCLQVGGRRDAADAPGGIQARRDGGEECERERRDDARDVHVGECLRAAGVGRVHGVERAQPEQRRPPSASPSSAPIEEITPTSTRCCMKICLRLAPSARRTPVIAALPRNFASSRPTVFSRQTARKMKARPTSTRSSLPTTSLSTSHWSTFVRRLLSGRWKRPACFCSLRVVVEEGLEALARRASGSSTHNWIQTHLGVEEVLVGLDVLRLPAVRVAGANPARARRSSGTGCRRPPARRARRC